MTSVSNFRTFLLLLSSTILASVWEMNCREDKKTEDTSWEGVKAGGNLDHSGGDGHGVKFKI